MANISFMERNGRKYQIEVEKKNPFCDFVRVYEFIGERVCFLGKAYTNDASTYVDELTKHKHIYERALTGIHEENDGFHCTLLNFETQKETSLILSNYSTDEAIKALINDYDCAILVDILEEIESEGK